MDPTLLSRRRRPDAQHFGLGHIPAENAVTFAQSCVRGNDSKVCASNTKGSPAVELVRAPSAVLPALGGSAFEWQGRGFAERLASCPRAASDAPFRKRKWRRAARRPDRGEAARRRGNGAVGMGWGWQDPTTCTCGRRTCPTAAPLGQRCYPSCETPLCQSRGTRARGVPVLSLEVWLDSHRPNLCPPYFERTSPEPREKSLQVP